MEVTGGVERAVNGGVAGGCGRGEEGRGGAAVKGEVSGVVWMGVKRGGERRREARQEALKMLCSY